MESTSPEREWVLMKKRHTTEEIITLLRTIERMLPDGATVSEVCRQLGIESQSYYRWK